MTERSRLHRRNPERQGPVRNFSGLFGQQEEAPDNTGAAPDATNGDGSWQDNVARGARAGYKVIEEQLQYGEKIARQLRGPSTRSGSGNGTDPVAGVQDIIENLGHYYTRTLSAYVELLQPLLQRGGASSAATPGAIAVRTASTRPATTRLHLTADGNPVAQPLLHSEGEARITAVEVLQGEEELVVDVIVPDDAPAGQYYGVVLDADTRDPIGTLTVMVDDAAGP